jgi:hypothetical protein
VASLSATLLRARTVERCRASCTWKPTMRLRLLLAGPLCSGVCVCVCTKVGEHPMSVCLSLSQPRLQVGRVAGAGRLAGVGARRALGSRAAVGIPPWATDPNRAKWAVCCTPAHRGQAKA